MQVVKDCKELIATQSRCSCGALAETAIRIKESKRKQEGRPNGETVSVYVPVCRPCRAIQEPPEKLLTWE